MRSRILIGLALLCYCLIYQVNRSQPFFYSRLCNMYQDAVARSGNLTPVNNDLVFLAIDADSIGQDPTTDAAEMYHLTDAKSVEARAFSFMTQRFPWPRQIYALALQRLVDAGAKVILFDLTFPAQAEGDEEFRQALEKYKEKVVIGSNFVKPKWDDANTFGATLSRPVETLVPMTVPMDDRVAYTNFWPDDDDVVRQAQYRLTTEQIDLSQPRPDSERFLSLAAEACIKMGRPTAAPNDIDSHILRFTGPPREGFQKHSFFEIFVPRYWKSNYHNGEFFRGKTVIIGAEGDWQHDELQTPFGLMPGPELHLNVINSALHGAFIRQAPPGSVEFLTALAAIAAVALSFLIGSPWMRLLALLALDFASAYGALYVFNHASIYLPLVAPMTQLNATILLGMLVDFTQERAEKKRVRRTLERYVSRDLVGQMLDQPDTYEQSLGGILKPVTILFSDIRGFTAVTTQSEPHVLVRQLNEYLSAMVDCVFRFEGTLDKFIGDAVMAVWGNIHSHGEQADALHAVQAARAMREELERLNELWKGRGWPVLKAGIAVHHGNVIVGNVGSAQRMEFTVIGEAVNVTWKLQEDTKRIGYPFVMSETVHRLLDEQIKTTNLGLANIPGLKVPLEIFTFSELVAARSTADSETAVLDETSGDFPNVQHLSRAVLVAREDE